MAAGDRIDAMRMAVFNRRAISYRLKSTPRLVIDCQYLFDQQKYYQTNRIGTQLRVLSMLMDQFREPWPINYVNFDAVNDERYRRVQEM